MDKNVWNEQEAKDLEENCLLFIALSIPVPRSHSKLARGPKELQINEILVVN